MFLSMTQIEAINEKTKVELNCFEGVLLVSGRDICFVQTTFEWEGSHFIVARSVVHPKAPEGKKFVRAKLIVGGWVITPIQASRCKCVYITCCDPSGDIGKRVRDYAAKE